MSGKFSNTGTTFNASSLLRQEEMIREIAQNEFFNLFEEIKFEIQTKIKSIDKNILQIKHELIRISHSQKQPKSIADILERIDKIQAEVQVLRYQQQFQLRSSRAKSYDKERKPIFKKNSAEHQDFAAVVLGLQSEMKAAKSEKRILEKKELNGKPPLPTIALDSSRPKSFSSSSQNKSEVNLNKSDSRPKRNPVLEDSGSIHRWLHENNSREQSCFNQIIRQQDIEESVFY